MLSGLISAVLLLGSEAASHGLANQNPVAKARENAFEKSGNYLMKKSTAERRKIFFDKGTKKQGETHHFEASTDKAGGSKLRALADDDESQVGWLKSKFFANEQCTGSFYYYLYIQYNSCIAMDDGAIQSSKVTVSETSSGNTNGTTTYYGNPDCTNALYSETNVATQGECTGGFIYEGTISSFSPDNNAITTMDYNSQAECTDGDYSSVISATSLPLGLCYSYDDYYDDYYDDDDDDDDDYFGTESTKYKSCSSVTTYQGSTTCDSTMSYTVSYTYDVFGADGTCMFDNDDDDGTITYTTTVCMSAGAAAAQGRILGVVGAAAAAAMLLLW